MARCPVEDNECEVDKPSILACKVHGGCIVPFVPYKIGPVPFFYIPDAESSKAQPQ